MRELKIIQARSYLNMMAARTNREEHTEQLDNCYNQIVYLERWRRKAIKLINGTQINNRKLTDKVFLNASKRSKLENEVLILEQENEHLRTQIENLTKNITL